MPIDDGWDWSYLYYMGKVVLHLSDTEFWNCTPRKLSVLTKIHGEVNNPDKEKVQPKKVQHFIDQVLF